MRYAIIILFLLSSTSCSTKIDLSELIHDNSNEWDGKEYKLKSFTKKTTHLLKSVHLTSNLQFAQSTSKTLVSASDFNHNRSFLTVVSTGGKEVFTKIEIKIKNKGKRILRLSKSMASLYYGKSKVDNYITSLGLASVSDIEVKPEEEFTFFIYPLVPIELDKGSKGNISFVLYDIPTNYSSDGSIKKIKNFRFIHEYSSIQKPFIGRTKGGLEQNHIAFAHKNKYMFGESTDLNSGISFDYQNFMFQKSKVPYRQ
jgi:hypothetical protein